MMGAWLEQVKKEWRQNARLRLGVIFIGCLLAVYEISGLDLIRQQLEEDYSTKVAELQRIRAISKEDSWGKRAVDAKALQKALVAEIPAADSTGLAQATLQGFLRDLASGFGARLNIATDSPSKVDGMDGYWKFPAQISGPVDVNSALQLVRQMEGRKDLLTVESVQLSTGENAYLNMRIVAYYRINAGSAPDAAH